MSYLNVRIFFFVVENYKYLSLIIDIIQSIFYHTMHFGRSVVMITTSYPGSLPNFNVSIKFVILFYSMGTG